MTLDVYAYAGEATPSSVIADTNPRSSAASGVFVSHLVFLTLAALVQVSHVQFDVSATPAPEQHGGGGIDVLRKKPLNIIKPTGLQGKKPSIIDKRVQEAHDVAQEVAAQLKNEFAGNVSSETVSHETPVKQMSLAEIEFEIGYLIKKQLRTNEEDAMLLILIAANL